MSTIVSTWTDVWKLEDMKELYETYLSITVTCWSLQQPLSGQTISLGIIWVSDQVRHTYPRWSSHSVSLRQFWRKIMIRNIEI